LLLSYGFRLHFRGCAHRKPHLAQRRNGRPPRLGTVPEVPDPAGVSDQFPDAGLALLCQGGELVVQVGREQDGRLFNKLHMWIRIPNTEDRMKYSLPDAPNKQMPPVFMFS